MTNSDTMYPFTIIGPRIRKSPFFNATQRYGCKAYSVYNHMYMPLLYADPLTDYWNLINNVSLWDVACERQVEISGADAPAFTQYLTSRNLSKCQIGQCMYAPILNQDGGILNDPVLLKLDDNQFWLSLADSDILLWAQGIALNSGMDVSIVEPDISPLALQGPKSQQLMKILFGNWIENLKFFRCREVDLQGIPLVVARSGWSKQGGFELYLRDSKYGDDLWELLMKTGEPFNIAPGAPSNIERIESGLLSYGCDMDMTNNPFEVGLDQYVDLEQEADFVGKAALMRIRENGITQKLVGIEISGGQIKSNENRWRLFKNGKQCGTIRSAIYSPRFKKNVAMAIVALDCAEVGTELTVETSSETASAKVVTLPFS